MQQRNKMKVVLCFFVLFYCSQAGEAAECVVDPNYPCTARCNGTSFDLLKAFDFPIKIVEPTGRGARGMVYSYMWDPCHMQHCGSSQHVAVCQSADAQWNCGQMKEPVWLMDDWPRTTEDFPNWHVEYTFGTTWRISIFNFIIDDNRTEPAVSFLSEDPYLQYNFEVRGKCIGQESFDCKDYYKSRLQH